VFEKVDSLVPIKQPPVNPLENEMVLELAKHASCISSSHWPYAAD
jgi:hypothetical protein